jgi:hypothetical protein
MENFQINSLRSAISLRIVIISWDLGKCREF